MITRPFFLFFTRIRTSFRKKREVTAQGLAGPRSPHPHNRDTVIILFFPVDFNILEEQEKHYPWPRLFHCPSCEGPRLWGHGYVRRYFDGHAQAMWLKRYRCPECGAVHTARPDTHYRRFWAPIRTILTSLYAKAKGRRRPSEPSRQRQRYWWKGFQVQLTRTCMHQEDPLFSLMKLFGREVILSTHSAVYCEKLRVQGLTYPSLSVTAPIGYG